MDEWQFARSYTHNRLQLSSTKLRSPVRAGGNHKDDNSAIELQEAVFHLRVVFQLRLLLTRNADTTVFTEPQRTFDRSDTVPRCSPAEQHELEYSLVTAFFHVLGMTSPEKSGIIRIDSMVR